MLKTICICGGGALAHTVAGYIASQGACEVRVLTRHPEQWSSTLLIDDAMGNQFKANLSMVTHSASLAVTGADIVLMCVPGFAIADVVKQIAPFVDSDTPVGSIVSSTGFFFIAHKLMPESTKLFGFQRVPFIARTTHYGHTAVIKGYKSKLLLATQNIKSQHREVLASDFEKLLNTPVELLNSYYEASLTNSNPLLHTSRIYSMWKNWHPGITYNTCPQFYADWTTDASRYYIAMDNEFQQLLRVLPVAPGAIPTVLDYYESSDELSLTQKLRSIEAFKGIMAPMVGNQRSGFVPDFSSRYFTEDFPFGLRWIAELAHEMNVASPVIDEVYGWGLVVIDSYSAQSKK